MNNKQVSYKTTDKWFAKQLKIEKTLMKNLKLSEKVCKIVEEVQTSPQFDIVDYSEIRGK